MGAEGDAGMLGLLAPSPQSEAVTHELEELSLQPNQNLPPLDERKNVLQLRLQQRRTREQLVDQGIMPPLKSPAAFHEQIRSLERARTENFLKHKIRSRPERSELVRMHILQETLAEPSLQATQLKLKRARLAAVLLPAGTSCKQCTNCTVASVNSTVLQQISTCQMQSHPRIGFPLVGGGGSHKHKHSASSCQSGGRERGPAAPPLSFPAPDPASLGTAWRSCGPDPRTPGRLSAAARAAVGNSICTAPVNPAPSLSPPQQSQPKSAADKSRSKKGKEVKPRVRKLKYHQYIPPDQKSEPSEVPMDSSYARLLHQQQLFLQLQILSQQQQHYNYQAILLSLPHRPVADGQNSTANASLNNNNNVPTSIVVSLPGVGSAARPNNSLALRKPGHLPANLDDMKVAELKMELKLRGLPVSGTKTDLIERLRPYQENVAPSEKDRRLHEKERQIEELMRKLEQEQRLVEELKMQLEVEKRGQQQQQQPPPEPGPPAPVKEEGKAPQTPTPPPLVKQEEPRSSPPQQPQITPLPQFFISPQSVPQVLAQPQTLLTAQPGTQILLPVSLPGTTNAIQLPAASMNLKMQPVVQAAVSTQAPGLAQASGPQMPPHNPETTSPPQLPSQNQQVTQAFPACSGFQFGSSQPVTDIPQCFLNASPESRPARRASPSHSLPNGPTHKPPFVLQPSVFPRHPPKSKDPPRYEEAVKQTRSLPAHSSGTQVPTATSQQMDDLFDILIESGEISPFIGEDPPVAAKMMPVTASITTLPISTVLSRPPPQVQLAPPSSLVPEPAPSLASLASDNQLEALLEGTLSAEPEARALGAPRRELPLMEDLHCPLLDQPHSPMDTSDLHFADGPPASAYDLHDANLDSMEWLDLTVPGPPGGLHPLGVSPGAGVFSSDFLDAPDLHLHWD
uniref:Myocardin related transcription factor Bb n=1 Tax=Lepisosteus oculatus TaxID=7918 RepID=W5ML78_LEPOC